ncbi:hypothetical protein, partial [Legionella drancourtii]|uniref:hypothetical protein n=1 Tax=Legionella drancourtii TaxID=168933 RepID=UPI00059081ED
MSEEAKKYYLEFLEGKKEEIVSIINKAQEVFSKQNIQHNQQGLISLSDLISQLQRQDSSNVPPELFKGVDDDNRWKYISAYSDVLDINKNWIKKAHHVVSQHNFQSNWQSLTALDKLIAQINQGDYTEIHPELFRNVHENEKAPLMCAYLDRLNHYKNIYQKAQEVINHQNFRCDQQSLTFI